jgi:hypothetical protein
MHSCEHNTIQTAYEHFKSSCSIFTWTKAQTEQREGSAAATKGYVSFASLA